MKKSYVLIFLLGVFLFPFQSEINAQDEKKLTIVVKDAQNKPIPGAVILFDNVRLKRWTNKKGVFKAKFTETPKEISAFSPKVGISKIAYNGASKVEIVIKDSNDLGLNRNPSSKGIKAMQFRNIYDYLRGQVPGVNVGQNNQINIRGYNSINGSTTPLFVLNSNAVDQVVLETVVPTTIRSVVILKGPEASKYGSRGANGVIEINTF